MLGVAREWKRVRADGSSGSESLCSVSLTSMSTTRTRTSSSCASSKRYGSTLVLELAADIEGAVCVATDVVDGDNTDADDDDDDPAGRGIAGGVALDEEECSAGALSALTAEAEKCKGEAECAEATVTVAGATVPGVGKAGATCADEREGDDLDETDSIISDNSDNPSEAFRTRDSPV